MNRYRLAILASLALALLLGCSRKGAEQETGGAAPVVEVKAVPVVRGDVEDAVVVEGATAVVRTERIASPISGVLTSVRAIEGASVHDADTLAVVRSGDAQAAIDGARALLRAATSETQRAEARRGYDLAYASRNDLAILATASGVVASRAVNQGELVSAGDELFTITDLASLYFAADIPIADLPKVRPGESCRVTFPSLPDVEIPARLASVDPAVAAESQSVKAHLTLGPLPRYERGLIKAGVFGTARIVTRSRPDVLLVPAAAVLRDDETNTASVTVVAGGVARVMPVLTGAVSGNLVEVSGPGVVEGTLVIVEGNYGLADSTRVRVTRSENK